MALYDLFQQWGQQAPAAVPTSLQAPGGMFGAPLMGSMQPTQMNLSPAAIPPKAPAWGEAGGWGDKLSNIGAILLAASGNPAGGALMQLQSQKRRDALDQTRLNDQNDRADAQLNKPQIVPDGIGGFNVVNPSTGEVISSVKGNKPVGALAENLATFRAEGDYAGADRYRTQFSEGPPTITSVNGQMVAIPRGAFGGSGGAPSGPAIGAVHNGYSFKGGNPNDKASWAPVGGAGSGPSTFR